VRGETVLDARLRLEPVGLGVRRTRRPGNSGALNDDATRRGRRDRKRLTALVSTAGTRREFRTNGGTGREKLIDAVSFAAWRLRKRDEALDRADMMES